MSQDKSHLSILAAGGLLSLVGSAVSALAGIALVVVVTRGYSQSEAGVLFATTSAFLIVVAATQLGTEVGLVRWLPTLRATGRHAEIARLLRHSLVPVAVVSIAVAVLMFITASPVATRLVGSDQREIGTTMLRCLSFFVPVVALGHAFLAATRGMGTMRTTVLVDGFGRSVAQPAVLLALAHTGGAAALAIGWVAPYGLAAAITALSLARQVRRAKRAAVERPVHAKPDDQVLDSGQSLSADFWSFTRPRAVATLAQAALKRLDIVLVAALRSPEEAAIYTAATRFLIVGQLGVQAVQQAMSPQLGGLFASGKHAAAQELYRTGTAWTMSFAWPVYLVSAFLAGLVLSLFDEGYGAGRSVIVILALAMLVATACGAVDALLLMSGRSWLSLANILIALGVNVVANVLLLPDYGIRGAAIAWALAIITRNMLGLLQVRYFLEIGFGAAGPAWWVAVSAGSSYGLVGVGLLALDVSEWVSLAVFIGLSTPLYAVMLWLRREDLHLSLLKSTVAARAGGRRRETVGSSR